MPNYDAHVFEYNYILSMRIKFERQKQEELEAQATARKELEDSRRDDRLSATGDEIDGFFSMAYPKAAKHAAHIIGKTKKVGESSAQDWLTAVV